MVAMRRWRIFCVWAIAQLSSLKHNLNLRSITIQQPMQIEELGGDGCDV